MQPAEKVIEKCGGAAKTAELAGVTRATVYRWTYPKDRGGTGGAIPTSAQAKLMSAARAAEINLQPADFFAQGEGSAA